MAFFVRSDRSTTGSLGVVLGVAVATVVLTSTPSAVVAGGVGGNAIPVPGLEALNVGGDAEAMSVSCAAPGECAAVGDYEDADGVQGFVVTQTKGVWGDALPVPGLKSLNVGDYARADSVSCAAPGECAASGSYKDAAGGQGFTDGFQGFVVTQTEGVWGDALPVPGLKALNVGDDASAVSVSCAAPGECAASGYYKPDADSYQGFVVTQTKGVWGDAEPVPGLEGLRIDANDVSVSCAAPGECAAVGGYEDAAAGLQGFVVTQTGGVWGDALPVPGLETLNVGDDASAVSVSCAAPGECAASGYYKPDADSYQGFVVTQTKGVWGDALPVPGLETLNVGDDASAVSVSCAAPGECAASGSYEDAADSLQGFVVTQTKGVWGDALPVPGLETLNVSDVASGDSVSCAAPGECAASGYYKDADSYQGFVVTQIGGVWGDALPVPGLEALNVGGDAFAGSVSCAAPGECAAVGGYEDAAGFQGFVFDLLSGYRPIVPTRVVDTRVNGGLRRPAGSTLAVDVGAQYANQSVSVNLTVPGAVGRGYATLYACDQPRPATSSLNYQPNQSIANGEITKVSATGTVCVFLNRQAHVVLDVFGVFPTNEAFTPIAPTRAVDTRDNGGPRQAAGSTLAVDVGAQYANQSVSVNLTVPGAVGRGYATLYACDQPRPATSSLNYQPNQSIANGVITKVSATGTVCVFLNRQAHVVLDVFGVFPTDEAFTPIAPTRAVDTRDNDGPLQAAGSTLAVDVGAQYANQSVSVNLTVPGAVGRGYATLYACDQPRPATSSLNYQPNQSIANGVITKVSADGNGVCVPESAGTCGA